MKEEAFKIPVNKSELFGSGNYGSDFNDIETYLQNRVQNPTSIIIRKGLIIDNLTFVYQGYSAVHGGKGGTLIETKLSQGDYIVKVSGTYGQFANQDLIETLTFTTKFGKVISSNLPYPDKKDFEYTAKEGHSICALFGRAGCYLNSIGVYTIEHNFNLSGMNLSQIMQIVTNLMK